MYKQKIITQIAVLRQSAKQLQNQAESILAYCNHTESMLEKDSVDWNMLPLPVSAEDIGCLGIACVKRAVKLDCLITAACKENDRLNKDS